LAPGSANAARDLSAISFTDQLLANQSDEELQKIQRYFKTNEGEYAEGDRFIGVRMGTVFQIAKEFIDMPTEEIERLMDSDVHEARAGAMSIMDKCARRKKTTEARRKALYNLYLRRHDRINNWDLVDLAAPFVVGGYLFDKPREVLFDLARSENIWKRRTAIVATSYFIRKGELDDTFAIAEILIDDDQDLIQKAVGGWVRECGKKDRARHLEFLDQNAARMPRTMLRYAIEHLDKDQKEHYRALSQ
jgi:3-methyladenine DNA glycosylase AlkD